MSMKAFESLREITTSTRQTPEMTDSRIKKELHPYLAKLIRELIEKYPENVGDIYSTDKEIYFFGRNRPKLMRKHYTPRPYRNNADINIETFLKKEIKTPANVLDLLYNIMKIEIHHNITLTGELSKNPK